MYHDILEEGLYGIPFNDNHFSFVFQRFLLLQLPTELHWGRVLLEMGRVVRPDGYLELQETDFEFYPNSRHAQRMREFLCAHYQSAYSCDIDEITCLDEWVKDHLQWSQVLLRRIKIPLGEWAGGSGILMKRSINTSLEAVGQSAVDNGVSTREWEEITERFWQDCEEYQICVSLVVVVAKKP